MVWILEYLGSVLLSSCLMTVVVIVIFKELSRAKVWMESGKVSSSLCRSCMGGKRKRGAGPDWDLPGQTLISSALINLKQLRGKY